MKWFMAIITCLALMGCENSAPEKQPSKAEIPAESGVTLTLTEIVDNVILMEVRNGTQEVFVLDELFPDEGYNVFVTGLNANTLKIYETQGFIRIKRAPPKNLTRIAPGKTVQRSFTVQTPFPDAVMFVKVHWSNNMFGTDLPAGGIESNLCERKKKPNTGSVGRDTAAKP